MPLVIDKQKGTFVSQHKTGKLKIEKQEATVYFWPEYQAVRQAWMNNGYAMPSYIVQIYQNMMMKELIDEGILSRLDWLGIHQDDSGSINAGRINFAKPSQAPVAGSPTYTSHYGISGTSGYLSGIPMGTNFVALNGGFGACVQDSLVGTNFDIIGHVLSPGGVNSGVGGIFYATNSDLRANVQGSGSIVVSGGGRQAHHHVYMKGLGANNIKFYRTKVLAGQATSALQLMTAGTWQIGRFLYPSVPMNARIAVTWIGDALDDKVNEMNDIIHRYVSRVNYQALIARATALNYGLPSITQQLNDQSLIYEMMQTRTFGEKDAIWNFMSDGSSDFATLNYRNALANQATKVNSPGYVVKKGFTSNGTSSYINSGFTPNTGAYYSLNGSMISVYLTDFTSVIPSGTKYLASADQATQFSRISTNGADVFFALDTLTQSNDPALDGFDANTLYEVVRQLTTNQSMYKNEVLTLTGASNSVNRPSVTMFILCRNNNETPLSFCNNGDYIGLVAVGTGERRNGIKTPIDNYRAL
jgi:hypothetical protein